MQLNTAQSEAAYHADGPMMVLAGPGSGKTMVITERTRILIEKQGITPDSLLVITFTKSAALEMKDRFLRLTGNAYPAVRFGTFHSVFFTILRYAYGYTADNIIQPDQQYTLLRQITVQCSYEIDDEKDFIQAILSEISHVKNESLPLDHYYSMNCPEETFRSIYLAYDKSLKEKRLLDYDDMMVYCMELFHTRPDILQSWQSRYSHILIDEFQDINRLQYELVRLLAAPLHNLFIVGDDDQSIYRFRGAKPEIMLNFTKDYPAAREVVLNQNYRSTSEIVNSAMRLIGHNANRYPKVIQAAGQPLPAAAAALNIDSLPCGNPVRSMPLFQIYANPREENTALLEDIRSYQSQGIPLSHMAVLYRTNTGPRAFSELLMKYNIPFIMKESFPNLYEHWITRDISAYLRLSAGVLERSLLLQVMNRPKRYLSRDSLPEAVADFTSWKEFYTDKDWMQERITDLEYNLRILKGMNPFAAIHFIEKGIGYGDYLKEYAEYRKIPYEDLHNIMLELKESARPYSSADAWFSHMKEYTKELRAQTGTRLRGKKPLDDTDALTLSTIHASKGLEYPAVFLPELVEGTIPYQKNSIEANLEEERRLFYVALTRAKKFLHLYTVEELYNKPAVPSRFLSELGLILPSSLPQSR